MTDISDGTTTAADPTSGASWRRELLLATLQAAVPVEISKVTEASTDHLVWQRDRWATVLQRADVVKRQMAAIYDTADGRQLTDDEQSVVGTLKAEATELYQEADRLPIGLLASSSDNLLFATGGGSAKVLEALAYSLGHMAHSPGGVGFAGLHWCAGPHRFGIAGRTPCEWEGGVR